MGLPMPNWEALAMGFLAFVFVAVGLTLLVAIMMDWYESR